MSSQHAADRLAGPCLALAFWLPLVACTWLALTPSPPEPVFRVSDVVLHGAAFGYLTFALGLAYDRLHGAAVAGWMLAYGVLIELLQSFEPARSAELKDLLVDTAGILAGLVMLRAVGSWSRQLLRRIIGAVLAARR